MRRFEYYLLKFRFYFELVLPLLDHPLWRQEELTQVDLLVQGLRRAFLAHLSLSMHNFKLSFERTAAIRSSNHLPFHWFLGFHFMRRRCQFALSRATDFLHTLQHFTSFNPVQFLQSA